MPTISTKKFIALRKLTRSLAETLRVELRGTLDPESRPGMEGANRKVKGTIHWVSAAHAVDAEIRLYDRLFLKENPEEGEGPLLQKLQSARTRTTALVESQVRSAPEQWLWLHDRWRS